MFARSALVVLALASLVGCHRRSFEREHAREEVIVTSTTVITNADVPPDSTAAPAAPAPAATATPTTPSEPLPPAPSEADRIARNLGMGDAGASASGTTGAPAPAAAPAQAAPNETPAPPPYRAPSAADPQPWAGDTHVPSQ